MLNHEKLSERQQGILTYISDYIRRQGRPPTIREIGRAVKISSTSVVNYNLAKLTEKGFLTRDAEVSRGLPLTDKAQTRLPKARPARTGTTIRIPLVGNIVAGEPIETGNDSFATYDEDDIVELGATMLAVNPQELFALRVSGESMIDAMVNDGDIVVMQQQNVARDGDMVAVWLTDSGTTTLKYFFHEGDKVRLQPANPTMGPIYAPTAQVQVQGKVMLVLRRP